MILAAWRELGRYLGRDRWAFLGLSAMSLFGGFSEAAVMVLVVRAALAMTDGDSSAGAVALLGEIGVGRALAIALVLSLAVIASHVVVSRSSGRLIAATVAMTRIRLVEGWRDTTWNRQLTVRDGDLQHTLTMLAVQAGGVAYGLVNLLTNALYVAALMSAAVVIDLVATVVVIAFGLLVFVVILPIRTVTRRLSTRLVDSVGGIATAANDLTRLSMELRTAGVDRRRSEDLVEAIRFTERLNRRASFLMRLGNNLYKDLAVVFLVGLIGLLHLAGGVPGVEFGAVVLLVVRAVGNAQAIQNGLQHLNEQSPGLAAFGERLDHLQHERDSFGSEPLARIDLVEIDRVGFSYGDGADALDEVSFHVRRGEAIGLVGPSGSGKSTLVHLLLRLRSPDRGAIRFNGTPIAEFDPGDFARRVGFVPQEPQLFDGTIADNIRFFRDDVTDDEIRDATRRAHLLAEVERLPDGLDTVVTSRSGLSGGQKQRLAIARSLVARPDLLILDEPTSALDPESEAAIASTLRQLRGEVTVVVIAHRPATVDHCDRLVHLRNGVVERVTDRGAAGTG